MTHEWYNLDKVVKVMKPVGIAGSPVCNIAYWQLMQKAINPDWLSVLIASRRLDRGVIKGLSAGVVKFYC